MKSHENALRSSSSNLMSYIKYGVYCIVIYTCSSAIAGSYDDFFAAIRSDNGEAVSALLGRGFDGNTRDPNGLHGLHLAVTGKSLKAAAALLDWAKIDVEPRNKADESPLMLAALDGNLALAKQLIAKGADVNKTGWTPLHYAATRGHSDVMTLLLDNFAYVDAASPNGTTPLMMAAFYGTPSAVKLMLEVGADPLLKNAQRLSAIDFAHRNNRMDSAEIISAFIRSKQPKGKW